MKGRTIGEHIRHHGDFVVHRRVRPHEFVNLFVDRATSPPLYDGVEQQLATSIGVLLPTIELIVDGEGDSFLESTLGVRRLANNVTSEL